MGPECVTGVISAQRKIYCFHVFVIWSPVILLGTRGRASCPEKHCVCVGGTKWPPSPSYILHPPVKSLASVIKEDQTLRTGDTEHRERREHRWTISRLSYLLHEPYGDHDWKCLPSGHTPPYTENPNFSLFSNFLRCWTEWFHCHLELHFLIHDLKIYTGGWRSFSRFSEDESPGGSHTSPVSWRPAE